MSEIELKLNSLPRSLNETYETILSRIHKESTENSERAHLLLQWLVVSVRPMTLKELVEVVALKRGQTTISNYDRLLDPRDILDICPGFLNLEDDGTVSRAHFSVKEFLVSERSQPGLMSNFSVCPGVAHGLLAEACLSYLLILGKRDPILAFEPLQSRRLSYETLSNAEDNGNQMLDEGNTKDQYQETVGSRSGDTNTTSTWSFFPDFPLAHYAACFWPWHYRHAPDNERDVFDGLVCKLLDRSLDFNFINWLYASMTDVQDLSGLQDLEQIRINKFSWPLFYAACLGLSNNVVSSLVDSGQDPRQCWSISGEAPLKTVHDQDLRTRSPLHAAAARGHKEVVECLLPHVDNIDLLDYRGKTPLDAAINGRQRDVVYYLVETGADVNYCGLFPYSVMPIQQAVQ